jgi:hypothetical protein
MIGVIFEIMVKRGHEVLGRVLGPARGAGNQMCQWVL